MVILWSFLQCWIFCYSYSSGPKKLSLSSGWHIRKGTGIIQIKRVYPTVSMKVSSKLDNQMYCFKFWYFLSRDWCKWNAELVHPLWSVFSKFHDFKILSYTIGNLGPIVGLEESHWVTKSITIHHLGTMIFQSKSDEHTTINCQHNIFVLFWTAKKKKNSVKTRLKH